MEVEIKKGKFKGKYDIQKTDVKMLYKILYGCNMGWYNFSKVEEENIRNEFYSRASLRKGDLILLDWEKGGWYPAKIIYKIVEVHAYNKISGFMYKMQPLNGTEEKEYSEKLINNIGIVLENFDMKKIELLYGK